MEMPIAKGTGRMPKRVLDVLTPETSSIKEWLQNVPGMGSPANMFGEYKPKHDYRKYEKVQEGLHAEFMKGKNMKRAMHNRGHQHAHPEACRLVERHLMTNDVVQCGDSARTARGEVQILAPYRCPNPLHVYVCRYHDIYTILMHVVFVQERIPTYGNVAIRLKSLSC